MTTETHLSVAPIAPDRPGNDATVETWVDWYWSSFLPAWVERARDPAHFGFFDELDRDSRPAKTDRRTILAQARLLFTFSHLALISDNPVYRNAARIAREALPAFRKSSGLYCRARNAAGGPTGDPEDDLAASYDQSFVILGLSTWGRLHPDEDVSTELEACWSAVEARLSDPATGLLLEHDGLADPTHESAPCRAQNPHMHLYEAALQAFDMTAHPVWRERAALMRAKGLEYFLDTESGTIIEFIAPGLSRLPGRDGQRREVGHQCEWAWLLIREAELGGDPSVRDTAARLLDFADSFGFATDDPMRGAAFDAVSADTEWRENSYLLWPQTEAIKIHAIRAQKAEQARDLALLVFRRYFGDHAAFANQLDAEGHPIWPDALSRLHYHLVLALTEGARNGLWRFPGVST